MCRPFSSVCRHFKHRVYRIVRKARDRVASESFGPDSRAQSGETATWEAATLSRYVGLKRGELEAEALRDGNPRFADRLDEIGIRPENAAAQSLTAIGIVSMEPLHDLLAKVEIR